MRNISLLFFFFWAITALSQNPEILVSEIKHSGGNTAEWTELLVTQDNINITGYTLRDNAGTSNVGEWQPAVIFTNNQLWQNLRIGTVIIVNHAGNSSADINPDDGFIEVSAQDFTFFEDTLDNGSANTATIGTLDLNTTHDIIQVRKPDGTHVHCLGFMQEFNTNAVFDGLPLPKIARSGRIQSSFSVSVNPGSSFEDYAIGFDNNNNYTIESSSSTEGVANTISSREDQNQLFWRELRQPDWNNPEFTDITIGQEDITLNWNNASNSSSNIEGYLLVRIPENELFDAGDPVDGRIYNAGDAIGSAIVVDHIEGLNTNSYIDDYEISCNESVIYRLYAYRYTATDNNPQFDSDPKKGRGRSYNERDFAESESVSKSGLNKPELYIDELSNTFCEGDEVTIKVNINNEGNFTYSWRRDNVQIDNSEVDEITVSREGDYTLVITAPNGCSEVSNSLTLNFNPKPNILISNYETNYQYEQDTTLVLCPGELLQLSSFVLNEVYYEWYNGDDFIINNQNRINVDESGNYYMIANNGGQCFDTSIVLSVEFVEEDFSVSPTNISFTADVNETNPEQTIVVTNNSNFDLVLTDANFQLPSYLEIVSPANEPYVVPANSNLNFVIRFNPDAEGETQGNIAITSDCGTEQSLSYETSFSTDITVLTANPADLDFGEIEKCIEISKTLSFELRSFGEDVSTIEDYEFKEGLYTVTNPDLSTNPEIEGNGSLEVFVQLIPTTPGKYVDTLSIFYRSTTPDVEVLRIALDAEIIEATPELLFSSIDFPSEANCDAVLDSTITITNNGAADMIIQNQPNETRVRFDEDDLPITIPAGETLEIPIFYEPVGQNEDFEVTVVFQPCGETFSFNVTGSASEFSVQVDKTEIDLGELIICQGDERLIEFFNIESRGEGLTISNLVYDDENIQTNLENGFVLNENDQINIILEAGEDLVDYQSQMSFTVEPCGDEFVINITGARYNIEYSLNPSPAIVDFGSYPVGATKPRQRLIVTNNSEVDIIISEIAGVDNDSYPFALMSPNDNQFPITIEPNDFYFFEFRYQDIEARSDTLLCELIFSSPCNTIQQFILQGHLFSDVDLNLSFNLLEERQFVELEETINYPVYIQLGNETNWVDVDVAQVSMNIQYNGSVLYPQGVQPALGLENALGNLNYNEIAPGNLDISFTVEDENAITSNNIVDIVFLGLMGDEVETEITISEPQIVINGTVESEVSTNNGIIEVTGDCNVRTRRVLVGGNVTLQVEGSNVVSEVAELTAETVVDSETQILLYNSEGSLAKNIYEGYLVPGKHSISFSTNELNQGIYYVVMKSGIRVKTAKIMILK